MIKNSHKLWIHVNITIPKWKKFEKKLIKNFQTDDVAEKANTFNETVLTKEINKFIKKNKSKPISTIILLNKKE